MSLKHTLIASAIMILTMVSLNYLSHAEIINPNKPFATFPKHIGEWKGIESRFDQEIYDVLGVDDSFLGNYKSPNSPWVNLYIGFYLRQDTGAQIHSPKNCMPGGGWNIVQTSIEEILVSDNKPIKIKVIKLLLQKGAEKQVVLYWYHSRGRIISSEYWQKIYRVVDSITKHRTDGSFVRLIAPVTSGDEEKALNTLKDFATQLMPILNEYLPS
jgi:EpsI family protein